MATVGVGVDIVDVERFAVAMTRHPRIVERLFTDQERLDARSRPERLAARFAAKEAVLKTLQCGVGAAPWRSIEVRKAPNGAPSILLHEPAAQLARRHGVTSLHVSLSHTELSAVAFVVGSGPEVSRAG